MKTYSNFRTYDEYIRYMESNNCIRNQICLDEANKRLVTLSGLSKGCTGPVIDIRCPCGWKISVYGVGQVPKGTDPKAAHSLKVILLDNNDNEIDLTTKIHIKKERASETIILVGKMQYSDINIKNHVDTKPKFKNNAQLYRFEQSCELKNEDHLVIYAIEPSVDINVNKIKFTLDLDMWELP
ncbi:MAG: hypothetical protein PHP08_00455 [Candidatus Dojkabacteria bacterium]|nr:hypothetical protein [Candidatus Dojkabacteria bacterium]